MDFQAVLVWKFDRVARSVKHLLKALETFDALKIGFISLTESIDTSTPYGKMVFTILGAVAELERSLIIERTKALRPRCARRAQWPGIWAALQISGLARVAAHFERKEVCTPARVPAVVF